MTSVPFRIYPGDYSVVQLPQSDKLPQWIVASSFYSLMKTQSELSVICESACVPRDVPKNETGWSCLEVIGPMEFTVTGVMASLSGALANEKIPLMAISTFDTDYLLVKKPELPKSIEALVRAGHRFQKEPS